MSSLQEQQRKYEAALNREYERMRNEEYREVIRTIRLFGGIRPYRNGRELEEWRGLPHSVKNRNGLPADEMAFRIGDEFPWLGIVIDSDLHEYLKRRRK